MLEGLKKPIIYFPNAPKQGEYLEMGIFGKKYKRSTCGAKFKTEAELMEHSKMHMNQAAPKSASFK